MASKALSIMPYFGGKARIADFITNNLNYRNSIEVFVDAFGGAGTVTLNKRRHSIEIYNDYSEITTSIMRMLSNPEKARKFIYRLTETEYTEEQFNWAKEIVNSVEMDGVGYQGSIMEKELKQILIKYGVIAPTANKSVFKAVLKDEAIFEILIDKIKDDKSSNKKEALLYLEDLARNYEKLKSTKEEQGYIERTRDLGVNVSEIDVAIAGYIAYNMSRDGRAEVFTSSKFKSTKHYRDNIAKLFDCAKRLEGVKVYQIDAMDFFRQYLGVNKDMKISEEDKNYKVMLEWISNPSVHIYADPSYISPKIEDKLLEDIDWKNEDNISEKIKEKHKGGSPKNLGAVYAKSFEYTEQENFVKSIYNAKAKIAVSNYDLKLYNKYLSPENGWKSVEFETFTSVGNKADNKRVEVLWMNY
ncbi:hypothetical protein B0H39_002486 [Clostridium beijerinckii]|uniref:hypothetical protein n=1 Tax=Clostridium beijerinckii TaxID=1520 RepID=UPI0014949827|nr:hypothetical protein [Clostridium beijerinckii]NOW84605.1 hypothetical protein [Clostridium beijerinckii]